MFQRLARERWLTSGARAVLGVHAAAAGRVGDGKLGFGLAALLLLFIPGRERASAKPPPLAACARLCPVLPRALLIHRPGGHHGGPDPLPGGG